MPSQRHAVGPSSLQIHGKTATLTVQRHPPDKDYYWHIGLALCSSIGLYILLPILLWLLNIFGPVLVPQQYDAMTSWRNWADKVVYVTMPTLVGNTMLVTIICMVVYTVLRL